MKKRKKSVRENIISAWDTFTGAAFNVGTVDTKHVDVLDGIRALSVLIVVWFHIWQQSWWQDQVAKDALAGIGVLDSNINWIPRTGYVYVDMMILLSGFLLFLPYAREMVESTERPSVSKFYARRVARIFPSYYICTIIFLLFFVRITDYSSSEAFWQDLIANLTFTQMNDAATYMGTKFNVVLWTVSMEMKFYLIFPLVAWMFKKVPIITYALLCGCSWVYYVKEVIPTDNISMCVNQFPTFLCVYANGMMGALIFVYVAKNLKHNKFTGIFFTGCAIFSLYFVRLMLKYDLYHESQGQMWQVQHRYALSALFIIFILGTAFSFKWIRWLFGNKVMKFLSGVSFNMYIWHQFLSVKLKEWHIPAWTCKCEPDAVKCKCLPQQYMGKEWQLKYFVICIAVSFAAAIIMTYLVERPLDKLIMKGYSKLDKSSFAENVRNKIRRLFK